MTRPEHRPWLRSPDEYASLIVQASANRQPLLGLLALYRESILALGDQPDAPACAAHVHGHAPCSLPNGHDGDHGAWVTDQ